MHGENINGLILCLKAAIMRTLSVSGKVLSVSAVFLQQIVHSVNRCAGKKPHSREQGGEGGEGDERSARPQ